MAEDLTGKYIADTYQYILLKPDLTKDQYCNGRGVTVSVINRDAIGTVKMYHGTLANDFETTGANAGKGKVGTDWEGWALCDGNNGTPDLKGRFPVGHNPSDTDYASPGEKSSSTAKTITLTRNNIPPHKHRYVWWSPENGNPWPELTTPNVLNIDGLSYPLGSRTDLDSLTEDNQDWPSPGSQNTYVYSTNTQDGSDNVSGQLELPTSTEAFDKRPPYTVLVFVKRIS